MSLTEATEQEPASGDDATGSSGRHLTPGLVLSAATLGLFVLVALIGPLVYPYDPVATNLTARLLPPLSSGPDGTFYLGGTDQLGRDVFSQIVSGSRVTLTIAVGSVGGGLIVGALAGMLSGYLGGWVDTVLMRIVDMQLAIPPIILALLMVAVLGPSVTTLIIALSITRWVIFARVARSTALMAKARPFVDAARVSGLSSWQILSSHIARFTVSPLLVVATMQLGLVVIAEAAISFLGLGTSPTEPSWGRIIANGRAVLGTGWWVSTLPGVALSVLVIAVAVLGDQLRDRTRQQGLDTGVTQLR